MAKTNFQIFNEDNAPERTYNDSEYKEATQRIGGVMPGMALSRMHNKMYYQWSAMCKAIANLIVNHGRDCMDNDVDGITRYLEEAIESAATSGISMHRTAAELDHPEKSVKRKHLADNVYTLPAPEAANNARFLRNDNTWQPVTPGNIGAYTRREVDDRLAPKAPLASPALTGTPTTPTAARGTNTAQIASTAFVAQAIDANFVTTVTNALAGKVSKSGDTMTGQLTVPSVLANDWFRARGDSGFYFEDHGGGWQMTDNDWVRSYNGKHVYTSGRMKADGGFEGTASNANTIGGQSLQWILNQINAAKTGIVAGNLDENGWVKFANGLIVQWGAIDFGQVEKYTTVNFPIRFPNRVLCLIPARRNRGNTVSEAYGDIPMPFDLKQEGFQTHFSRYPLYWLALGI